MSVARRRIGSPGHRQFAWTFIDLEDGRVLQSGWQGDYDGAWSHANDLTYELQHPIQFEAEGQPAIVDVTIAAVFPKDMFDDFD